MVFLPLAGALLMMLIPKGEEQLLKVVALGASLASAAFGIAVMADFDYDDAGTLQFVVDHEWIDVIQANYFVGIDGLSLPLIALTLLITPLCIIYSWNHFPEPHNPKAFLILILVLHTGMLGTFVAQDLILFFVFFEVVLLPMYFMIGVWGGEQRQYASIKFFLYTLFGSALMIVSFLALFFVTRRRDVLDDRHRRAHREPRPVRPRAGRALHPGADLRRHVHGLRHQGADVPVPHLAARRPHPGAHGGLGDPGRGAPEARHLRLHPGRPADPPGGRGGVGARGSASSPSSASSTAPSGASPRPT